MIPFVRGKLRCGRRTIRTGIRSLGNIGGGGMMIGISRLMPGDMGGGGRFWVGGEGREVGRGVVS